MSWANMFNGGGGGGAGILEAAKTAAMEAALWALTGYTDLGDGFYDSFLYDSQTPVMTAETTSGVTVTASAVNSTNYAWLAFNGSYALNNAWVGLGTPAVDAVAWLKVSSATTRLVSCYSIHTRNTSSTVYSPNTWRMYVSNAEESPATHTTLAEFDGDAAWTPVHTVVGNTVNTSNTKLGDYVLDQVYNWRHMILVITASNNAGNVSIGEINVYGGGVNSNTVTNATIASGKITPTVTGGGSGARITSGTMTARDEATGDADNVLDSNLGTSWQTGNLGTLTTSNVAWILHSFTASTSLASIVLKNNSNSSYSAVSPKSYVIFGGNASASATGYTTLASFTGNGNWTQLHSVSGSTNVTASATILNQAISGTYDKIVLVVTESNGNGLVTDVADMEIYESSTPATVNEATIISTADTASSAPTHAVGLIWLDADGSTVTNATESNNAIRLYFTRNGSAWQWLPLEEIGTLSGDVKLYACNEAALTTTSGTSVKLKVTSHNLGSGAPNFELHGWGTVYKVGS